MEADGPSEPGTEFETPPTPELPPGWGPPWTVVVELIDSSSCKFFSYSVCFPCCISSFVKLAASSPARCKLINKLFELWTKINREIANVAVWLHRFNEFSFRAKFPQADSPSSRGKIIIKKYIFDFYEQKINREIANVALWLHRFNEFFFRANLPQAGGKKFD